MRCLLASDIHGSQPYWDWLLARSHHYDSIAIAGDLIHILDPLEPQVQAFLAFTKALKVPLAVCCGNHDSNDMALHLPAAHQSGDQDMLRLLQHDRWLDTLAHSKHTLTSGESRLIGGLIVTSLPWGLEAHHTKEECTTLLMQGAQLRKQHKLPWLVMHHVPPSLSQHALFRPTTALHLTDWLQHYQPNVCLTGHVHPAPFKHGHSYMEETTQVLNPGRRKSTFTAITWDTTKGDTEWIREPAST
jgi:predicted phosphodiesterase